MADYPTISPLPEHPQRGEPRDQFASKANEFVAALPGFGDDVNAAGQFVDATASQVADDADTASAAASAAVSAANAAPWDPLVEYSYPDTVIGSDGVTYRFIGDTPATGDDPTQEAVPGTSWSTVSNPLGDTVSDVEEAGGTWVGAGAAGGLVRSTDDGQSWSSQSVGITDAFGGVAGTGGTWVACAPQGVTYRSTDDGQTWSEVTNPSGSILEAIDVREGTWVIVGSSGAVLRSTDDGATWSDVSPGQNDWLYAVFGLGAGLWVAVGEAGAVVLSDDDGQTWGATTSYAAATLNDVRGDDDSGVLVAVGNSETILRSVDAGATWSDVSTAGAKDLNGVGAVSGTWVAVGSGSTFYRSTDGGETWTAFDAVGDDGDFTTYAAVASGGGAFVASASFGAPFAVADPAVRNWLNLSTAAPSSTTPGSVVVFADSAGQELAEADSVDQAQARASLDVLSASEVDSRIADVGATLSSLGLEVSGYALEHLSELRSFVPQNDFDQISFVWGDGGSKLFVLSDPVGAPVVAEYGVSEPYTLNGAAFVQETTLTNAQETSYTDIAWNDDGLKLYLLTRNFVHEYDCSTAFDPSSASFLQFLDVTANSSQFQSLTWKTDGTRFFAVDDDGIAAYDCSTSFDVSSATFSAKTDIFPDLDPTLDGNAGGHCWGGSGTLLFVYIGWLTGDGVALQYHVREPFEPETAVFIKSISAGASAVATSVRFEPAGKRLFIGGPNQRIYEYSSNTLIFTGG